MKTLNPMARQWLKRVLIVVCVSLLFPAVQVGLLWLFNPPNTMPMLLRWCNGKFVSAPYQPNHFQFVTLNTVPTNFLVAVFITEDRHFFEHWGFDWGEIQKSREEARASSKPARGASTITQQCARSLFLWQGRSWFRKGLEAYYTIWMELLLSKKRILELYVNAIELGDGIYGVDAAAQKYYGVSADKLTREQAAMLVAIMPNPKQWNPNQPSERVLKRQAMVLERAEFVRLPAGIAP